MIIQTLGKNYTVIKYCYSDNEIERYICIDEKDRQKYTIVRVKSRDLISQTMMFLMGELENTDFTDFVDCFVSEEFLHVVLRYVEGINLREKISNEICTLEERIIIGKKMLERMMLLNMSNYFQQDCLRLENIIVQNSVDIAFQYEMRKIEGYKTFTFDDVCLQLFQVIEFLFSYEIKKKMIIPLNEFCNKLKKKEFDTLLEIYTEYGAMCEVVLAMKPEDMVMPKTGFFLCWEKIKKYIKPFKKIIAVVLLLAAIFFLIYTLQQFTKNPAEKKVFEYIGTLEIRNK